MLIVCLVLSVFPNLFLLLSLSFCIPWISSFMFCSSVLFQCLLVTAVAAESMKTGFWSPTLKLSDERFYHHHLGCKKTDATRRGGSDCETAHSLANDLWFNLLAMCLQIETYMAEIYKIDLIFYLVWSEWAHELRRKVFPEVKMEKHFSVDFTKSYFQPQLVAFT